MSLFRRDRSLKEKTLDVSMIRGQADREGTIKGLEKSLDLYRNKFRLDPEAGTELAKRLAILSVLHTDEGNLELARQFKREATSIINSSDFPDDDAANTVKNFVENLKK